MKWNYKTAKRGVEALLFVVVLAFGWRYPYLAYCLLVNVAVGLYSAFRHGGRHGCGNFCPRGAFYSFLPDTGRKVPSWLLKQEGMSFAIMISMVGLLIRWLSPFSLSEWGMLMYIMICITTTIGLIGWLVFNRYFWCTVCPMGDIYTAIRPGKSVIHVADSCVKCGLCAKACPFGFFPPEAAKDGVFSDIDCIHCQRCVERCPKHALKLTLVSKKKPLNSMEQGHVDS